MVFGLVAISGILAAEPAAVPQAAAPVAVEISFVTHAGEGASGRKRFGRDGCYQIESGGSTGGAGYARDSQAGCHLPADVAAAFAKLASLPGDAFEREKPARGSAAGGAPNRDFMTGRPRDRVVLIRADGSRWVAAKDAIAVQIEAAVNELPSENQWHAKPPEKPAGTGPQLLVVSYSNPLGSRSEASLAADGRWWCYQSVIGSRGREPRLPAKPSKPLQTTEAAAKLARILRGARPDGADDVTPTADKASESMESAEVIWPGHPRAPLRPKRLTAAVIGRFADEMDARAPTCPHRAVH